MVWGCILIAAVQDVQSFDVGKWAELKEESAAYERPDDRSPVVFRLAKGGHARIVEVVPLYAKVEAGGRQGFVPSRKLEVKPLGFDPEASLPPSPVEDNSLFGTGYFAPAKKLAWTQIAGRYVHQSLVSLMDSLPPEERALVKMKLDITLGRDKSFRSRVNSDSYSGRSASADNFSILVSMTHKNGAPMREPEYLRFVVGQKGSRLALIRVPGSESVERPDVFIRR
jgi:hypothetical protein